MARGKPLTVTEIRSHPGPLRAGRHRFVRVADRWIAGGTPKRMGDPRCFAKMFGFTAESLRRYFGDITE